EAIEGVVRTHLVTPLWGPPLGRLGARVLESGGHHEAVDLLLDRLDEWLAANPDVFAPMVSRRPRIQFVHTDQQWQEKHG
ncbi:hypothetical protein SB775_33330, partial [Peribacillus sp. SIMBA_075]